MSDQMHKILIKYKSGNEMIVKTTEFTIKRGMNGLEVEWNNDIKPRPLLMGVDEIESIWVL